jgi:phenylpropionate dioxygenase-like ring-hydroxylating dioxygenase large terminal subunit
MLVTKQPVLRRFWYPVMPVQMLDAGPQPFTLLGEDIVLWMGADGVPAAAPDKCPHRSARLSRGWVKDGQLICGYHGWTFDGTGACTRVPQRPDHVGAARLVTYRAEARYGFVWVALDEPLSPLPDIPEWSDDRYRLIPQFYEVWNCAGLRLMENEFDNAHVNFVHRDTFGLMAEPVPPHSTIEEKPRGFVMRTEIPVQNIEMQKKNLRQESDRTMRHVTMEWWMPFARSLELRYPDGLVHTIITAATPIDDRRSQIVQFALRNDTEADAPAEGIVAFDRRVTSEDRAILETTTPDVPLDLRNGGEVHMASDRPGLLMRKYLSKLLAEFGEREVTGDGRVPIRMAAAE